MLKVVFPHSFAMGVPIARIADIHSRGIDRAWMQKRAAVLTKEIADVRPEDDTSVIHLITMGSQEHYGHNRNGDGFNEKSAKYEHPEPEKGNPGYTLLDHGLGRFHQTFLKYANVFKDHVNKDPKMASGKVLAEAMNPDMHRGELLIRVNNDLWAPELEKLSRGEDLAFSMSCKVPYDICLAPGTQVRTARGVVAIEDVTERDTVLTHMGRYRRVTRSIRTVLRRAGISVHLVGRPDPVVGTKEHPFFVVSAAVATANQKQFRRKEHSGETVVGVVGYQSPSFVEAGKLTADDFCLFPIRRENLTPDVDPWLAGLYLADGSLFGQRRGRSKKAGQWRLTGVRWSLGLDKREIIDKLLAVLKQAGLTPRVYPDKRAKAVAVVVHSRKLAKTLGRNFDCTKDKHLAPRVLRWHPDYLCALLAGWLDGDGSQGARGAVRGCTVLDKLADGLWEAAAIAGVPAAWHREVLSNAWSASPHTNVLFFAASTTPRLAEHSVKISAVARRKQQQLFYIEHDDVTYLAVPINRLERTELTETYNLSVAEDESYVAGGILTHNCTICGHKAANRKEYCGHLKDEMCHVKEGGWQVGAINDRPLFFDISGVFRPADRIAYGLQKVASTGEMPEEIISSARIAELWGISAPASVLLDSSPRPVREKLAAMKRMAAMEKQVEATGRLLGSDVDAGRPTGSMPEEGIEKMRGCDMKDLMGALSSAKICLPVGDFLRYVLGNKYDSVAGETDKVASLLPGIFSRMLKSGDGVDDVTGMTTYDPGASLVSREVRDLIDGQKSSMSMAAGPVGHRLQTMIVRGDSPSGLELRKVSSDQTPGKTAGWLAKQYAAYQLAFIRTAADAGDGLTEEMTVLRNYAA